MADQEALDAQVIRDALPLSLRQAPFELTVMQTVDSTNTWLSARAAGAVNGTSCLAEHQLAGRGRGSRIWVSPFGCNVHLSMVWRFPARQVAGLSIAVGVCVAEACDAMGACGVSLKWPNDLIVAREDVHHKLGGILIDVAGDTSAGEGGSVAVIGIGLNVDMPISQRTAITQPVCDLTELVGGRVSRNALVAQVMERLMLAMPLFEQQGLAPFRARFLQRDVNYDRPVRIEQGAHVSTGLARGIDETGALMVETSHGLTRIYSGDVSLRTMR
ncbi:MAG: BirA family biotin operon repressor/biotin-[acetyl-CoA-carboxylase] ligase [Gammaproteobacteria bacterium]|jgi:BirA family biotin operon repressor/biotin-[acetyl-CoA-carboxylase] ligase